MRGLQGPSAPGRPLLPLLPALAAPGLERGLEVPQLAVLAVEVDEDVVPAAAEVGGVDEEALLAALHVQNGLGHRRVGEHLEGAAQAPALDRVDAAVDVQVDLVVV